MLYPFLGDSLAAEFYVPTFRNTVSFSYLFLLRAYTNYEDGTDRVFRNVCM
jgi:hypothetical protein